MDNKIKILVVDDDDDTRELFSDVFRNEGFEVGEAKDGAEGLDKAISFVPDIVLTGIIMPKIDGFGLKDALSKVVATAKTPVMMLSHMGREEDRKKAEELGIKEFVVKGMTSPKEVSEKIRNIIQGNEYVIRFNHAELDAPKLAIELNFLSGFKCSKCQGEMILFLKKGGSENREFCAKFVCEKCRK
jgi:DNA-binding response OmpR family regulator